MDAKNNTPLIETKKLNKYFNVPKGVLKAVDGVDMQIHRGKTLGVVGESGCGKSTLGKTLLGIHPSTGGEIIFDGKPVSQYNKQEKRQFMQRAQMIFQDPNSSLNARMTVNQIIADPLVVNKLCANKAEREERVKELMETVGLAQRLNYAYPHELDGGRLQRVGIARCLSLNPEFIVCDEPVSALDVSIQAQILNLLMDLQEEKNLTYMFVTHDLSVVKHISDEIMVMYLGRCVEKAPTNELFKNPQHPYTKALLAAIPMPNLDMRRGLRKRELIKGELTSPINPKPGCAFAARCPYATAACTGEDLPLTDLGGGHQVACRLFMDGK